MATIRVDPSILRQSADKVQESSQGVNRAGESSQGAANAAPSYDGQFGPSVWAIGREALARAHNESNRLDDLSGQLSSRAGAFEAADVPITIVLGDKSEKPPFFKPPYFFPDPIDILPFKPWMSKLPFWKRPMPWLPWWNDGWGIFKWIKIGTLLPFPQPVYAFGGLYTGIILPWKNNTSPLLSNSQNVISPANRNADLAEIDSKGLLSEQPTLFNWFSNAFDVLEKSVGLIAAKSLLSTILGILGLVKDGGELVVSSNKVSELSQKWQSAMDQYGANSGLTLKARYEYSSAELEQALTSIPLVGWIGGIAVNALKAAGIWDDLIHSYEKLKYG